MGPMGKPTVCLVPRVNVQASTILSFTVQRFRMEGSGDSRSEATGETHLVHVIPKH